MSENSTPTMFSGIYMDDLVTALDQHPNGTLVIVEWEKGARTLCKIDTVYESDNGLDMDDKNYEEYFMCVLEVVEIQKDSTDTREFTVGSLLDICIKSPIARVLLKDETPVWESKGSGTKDKLQKKAR